MPNIITLNLSVVCIIIELYYLFFINHVLSYINPVIEIQRAVKYLKKSSKATGEIIKIAKNNKYVNQSMPFIIGDTQQECLADIDCSVKSENIVIDSLGSHALALYIKEHPSGALWYLFYVGLELVYLILTIWLAVALEGFIGIGLIVWSVLISHIRDWLYNHEHFKRYWRTFYTITGICSVLIYLFVMGR